MRKSWEAPAACHGAGLLYIFIVRQKILVTCRANSPSPVARIQRHPGAITGADSTLIACAMDLAGASEAGLDALSAAPEQQPELGARLQELVRQAEAQAQQVRVPERLRLRLLC